MNGQYKCCLTNIRTVINPSRTHHTHPQAIDNKALKAANEADKDQTYAVMGEEFNRSVETARQHLHQLGKRYKVEGWITYELTAVQKVTRANACVSLLSRQVSDLFL